MSKLLPANRVVLILHLAFTVTTAVALFVAAVSSSLPSKWQNTLGVGVGILAAVAGATVTVSKFLSGSQKFDALKAAQVSVGKPESAFRPDGPVA